MTAARALLVRGGRVLDLDGDLARPPPADLLVEDGRIVAVAPEIRHDGAEIIDATGMLVVPGFVNAHYHSHDVLLRGSFEQLPLDVWGLLSFPSSYPRRSADEVRLRTALGAAELLRGGITTVQDMVSIVGPDREHARIVAEVYGAAGLRCVLGLQVGDKAVADSSPFWRDHLSADILARFADGSDAAALQRFVEETMAEISAPLLRWALAPSAPQRCSEALLRWIAEVARREALQVFTHVYETRSQALLARSVCRDDDGSFIGLLDRLGLLGPHLAIAHGVWITPSEVARVGAAGAHVSINAMSNLKLMNGVAPVRAYAGAGAGLAVGCDNCSCSDVQNIFQAMKMFALAWGFQGPAGEEGAARAAFTAATQGGARALGLEGQIGALRPGYRADLVLIDLADPAWRPLNHALRQLVYAETGRAVRTVLVDGRVVVRDGRMVAFDEDGLTAEAERAREVVQADLGAVRARNTDVIPALLELHAAVARRPLDLDRFRLTP